MSPNQTLTEFEAKLSLLEISIQSVPPNMEVVVAGDLNANSFEWGCTHNDPRGLILAEVMALNFSTLNFGDMPTYQRVNAESIIDVSFTRLINRNAHDWRVLDEYTASDHRYIQFTLRETVAPIGTEEETTAEDAQGRKGWHIGNLMLLSWSGI